MSNAFNLSQLANNVNSSGQVALGTGVSGTLPIANGGTNNGSLAVTAGGVVYTDGSKLVNVGAGTSGQVLQSNGASAPSWAAASGGGYAGYGQQVFTSSGTFTVPTGVTVVTVTVVGAGGGGAGGNANNMGAGGAGGYCKALITGLTSGGTISVTIGTATRAANGANGTTGGTSSFGSYVSCTGGGGGGRGVNSGAGGAGGTVTVAGATALFSLTGGSGDSTYSYSINCGSTNFTGSGGCVCGNGFSIDTGITLIPATFNNGPTGYYNSSPYPFLQTGTPGTGSAASAGLSDAKGYGCGGSGMTGGTTGSLGGNGIVIVEY